MPRTISYTTDYQIEEEQQEDSGIICFPAVLLVFLLEVVGVLAVAVVWLAYWIAFP